jgi:hypothetical protein
MENFDDRTTANMNVALEDVCRNLPNSGGDHESRKFVARKIMWAARRGERTLGGLEAVGRRALKKISRNTGG